MLASILISIGVLALLHSTFSFLNPNLGNRGWMKLSRNVNPTISLSSVHSERNVMKATDDSTTKFNFVSAQKSPKSITPPQRVILNDLKTGMQLGGSVISSTPYAAFIDAGVVRVSKGGSFTPVSAFLHKSDITPPENFASLKELSRTYENPKAPFPRPLLAKGIPVTVFVKEVFKQAGRFTVTTDPTVSKADVLESHQRIQQEGADRRQSRRLRRQLENVVAGVSVIGIVDRVIEEGVLVTINSLGSLNVTALISKEDLPQHMKVPPSMKSSFQVQLMEQDFLQGRPVLCGVSEVHAEPSTTNLYNLKVMFEEFGRVVAVDPKDASQSQEKAWAQFKTDVGKNEDDELDEDNEDDDYEDDEADRDDDDLEDLEDDLNEAEANASEGMIEFDAEVRSLFEELVAKSGAGRDTSIKKSLFPARTLGSKLLPVESLYAWDALQDMLDEGGIEKADVDAAVRSVGASTNDEGGTLNLEQFRAIVDLLQDKLWGEEGGEDGDSEDQQVVTKKANRPSRMVEEDNDMDDQDYADEDEEDEEDEDEEEVGEAGGRDDTEQFDAFVSEVYGELKGPDGKVSVKALKNWADVTDIIDSEVMSPDMLDTFINIVLGTETVHSQEKGNAAKKGSKAGAVDKRSLDFEQFSQIVRLLDDAIGIQQENEDEAEDRLSETDEDEQDDDEQDQRNSENEDEVEDEDDDSGGLDAAHVEETFRELSVKQKGKVVRVDDFLAWSEIRDLMDEGLIGEPSLRMIIESVTGGEKDTLTLSQFSELIEMIHAAMPSEEDGDDNDNNEDTEYGNLVEPRGSDSPRKQSREEDLSEENDPDDTEEDDEDDEELDPAHIEEIFQELSQHGDGKSVRVEDFLAWDEMRDIVENGVLEEAALRSMIASVAGKSAKKLSLKQFSELMALVDEALPAEDDLDGEGQDNDDEYEDSDDGEEEQEEQDTHQEDEDDGDRDQNQDEGDENDLDPIDVKASFDELSFKKKGKAVRVEDFLAWSEMRDLVEEGLVDDSSLRMMVDMTAGKKAASLTLDQFSEVMSMVQKYVQAGEDDAEEEEKNRKAQKFENEEEEDDEEEDQEPNDDDDAEEEDGDDELDPADVEETFRELSFKKKGKAVRVEDFLAWSEMRDLVEEELIDEPSLRRMVKSVTGGKVDSLTLSQFSELLSMVRDAMPEEEDADEDDEDDDYEDQDEEDEDEDEAPSTRSQSVHRNSAAQVSATMEERMAQAAHDAENGATDDEQDQDQEEEPELSDEELEAMSKELFQQLLPVGRATVPIRVLLAWPVLKEEIKSGMLTKDEITASLKLVDPHNTGELNYAQFVGVMDILEDKMAQRANDSMDEEEDESEKEEEELAGKGFGGGNGALSSLKAAAVGSAKKDNNVDKALDEVTEALYSEILGDDKELTVQKLEAWEELQEMFTNGEVTKESFQKALKAAGAGTTGPVSPAQFATILDSIQDQLEGGFGDDIFDDEDEGEEGIEDVGSAVKAPAQPATAGMKVAEPSPNGEMVMKNDQYDFSNAYETLNALNQKVKNKNTTNNTTKKTGQADEEENDDEEEEGTNEYDSDEEGNGGGDDDDEEDSEQTNEEAAREIYDTLRGDRAQATVADFLQWEDMVELEVCGAVSRKQLDEAIQKVGIEVPFGGMTHLPFEKFYELVNIMEDYIDYSKLRQIDQLGNLQARVTGFEQELAEEEEEQKQLKESSKQASAKTAQTEKKNKDKDKTAANNPAALKKALQDATREMNNMEKTNKKEEDLEAEQDFARLSKGKGYITEKALRGWDDLTAFQQEGIYTAESLDYLVKDLQAPEGKVDFALFQAFLRSLYVVLLDKDGNVLPPEMKHLAVSVEEDNNMDDNTGNENGDVEEEEEEDVWGDEE